MNYGFVIDNRACIGCHACSTACKSENDVPLGVYRTWVKYTETGRFPNAQRAFQVTRCNHCANPPCVAICPTAAMYQRADGIVEFDGRACIGCKACMQACPYDAIYIDPETHTAAKCHYCAHRVEVGLEPSCVVVCPTHAIIAGDLDDPDSEIARVISRARVTVRKPEQGTAPKLFYIEGASASLVPTAPEGESPRFSWADAMRPEARGDTGERDAAAAGGEDAVRPSGGPAVHGAMVSYNAQHVPPWHWPVPAYLVTKAIATGVFSLIALAWLLGLAPVDRAVGIAAGGTATLFMLATTALLVADLEQPRRFLFVITRPQWRSWLTRGALLLAGFSAIAAAFTALEAAAHIGWIAASTADAARWWLVLPGLLLAAATAVYTAFLFGQAEGRDLWQSALLPMHLIVQAAIAGGAAVCALGAALEFAPPLRRVAAIALAAGLVVDLFALLGELGMSHASDVAARGARAITRGRYRGAFWLGVIAIGHVAPLALLAVPTGWAAPAASAPALAGLYLWEHVFVMAPQRIPNS